LADKKTNVAPDSDKYNCPSMEISRGIVWYGAEIALFLELSMGCEPTSE
jgi:hypothetical protein